MPALPRATNTERVGVVLVHGVGTAAHSDTLIDFGRSFAGWVARWQRAQGIEPSYGAAALNFVPYDGGSDHPIPYAELRMPRDPSGAEKTWVMAEAWWASSARPLPFLDMFFWSLHYLWSLVASLFFGTAHRLWRVPSRNKSIHDASWQYRVVDVLASLGHLVVYPLVAVVGYLLVIPLMALAQLPIPQLQNFIVVTFTRIFLQYNASELRVYYEDEIQAANMRRRVAEAVAWVTRPAADGGGDCATAVIVAHSGGCWVAHGMLTDPAYADLRDRVRKFITLGNGMNKIWEVAPSTVTRLFRPVEGDIFWLDFWGSYDPVPNGWLKPPKPGTCIYRPDGATADRHRLEPRVDPKPPMALADSSRSGQQKVPKDKGEYWPESVRCVNRMDALTDHGGYFTNDEEVLRRVACEIDRDLYQDSMFWNGYNRVLEDAIPKRRNRVAWLAGFRVLAVLVAIVAVRLFALDIALRLEPYWPVAPLLNLVRSLATVPVLATVAAWLGAIAWWAIGAAVASLIGLIPFEMFRAGWEARDRSEQTKLLRATSFGWPRFKHPKEASEGKQHTVFTVGRGPIVILMHEIFGITPEVEQLARIIAGRGFTVWLPEFFGEVGRPRDLGYAASCFGHVCVSREFSALATGKTSPIASWLGSLADRARSDYGSAHVGAIGMCFSGGFALAMAVKDVVAAPVMCEPALPFWPWAKQDVGLSPHDIKTLKDRQHLEIRGYRFTCDGKSPRERFERLETLFPGQFKGTQIDSGPGNPYGIPKDAHSVLTVHRIDNPKHPTAQALEDVLKFLDGKLKL